MKITDELRKRGKLPYKNELEAKIISLIQRLSNLIDENRQELEVTNKRIDHLSETVRKLLGMLFPVKPTQA